MANVVPGQGEKVQLHAAATTGNGLIVVPSPGVRHHTIYLRASAGIGAGKVVVEHASYASYAGTWVAEVSEVTLVASAELAVIFTGARGAIRVRVSTTVTGGTFDSWYLGIK